MKYLITIAFLLIACSNPTDTTEYTVQYFANGEGFIWNGSYYNPEADSVEEWDNTQLMPPEMIGMSGQLLWMEIESTGYFSLVIYVDGEIAIESEPAETLYVEYLLP